MTPHEFENLVRGWKKLIHHVWSHHYLQSKLLPDTCLRSWDRLSNFVDDPDSNPDPESGLLSGSLGGGLHF